MDEKLAETCGINADSFSSLAEIQNGVYVDQVIENEKSIGQGKAVVYYP
jgi:hypothetical protein